MIVDAESEPLAPLQYRDREDDDSEARFHTRRIVGNWIAVPAVIVSALTGVLFHLFGTGCLVLAVASSVHALNAAAGWTLAAFGCFGVGLAFMLFADRMERWFC